MKKIGSLMTLTGLVLTGFFGTSSTNAEFKTEFSRSQNYDRVKVEKILRADTFKLDTGEKIKMIGLVTPDPPRRERVLVDPYGVPVKQDIDPTSPIEVQAINLTTELLQNQVVRLEFDQQVKGDDFETLAYVYLPDGTFLNELLLKQGLAQLKISPPNLKHAKELRSAYQEARREKRGLQGE